jgi:hypothetical protein
VLKSIQDVFQFGKTQDDEYDCHEQDQCYDYFPHGRNYTGFFSKKTSRGLVAGGRRFDVFSA